MNRPVYHLLSGRFGAELELRILMRQSARALQTDAPKFSGHSAPDLLRKYARFTADEAARVLQSGQDLTLVYQRLNRMARRLGSSLRRWLRPKDERDCLAVIRLVYRNIGISINEEKPGEFCVLNCYFSDFYTPEVCAVISAVDAGIFSGIYQGGTLVFRERITEGKDVCRAWFGEMFGEIRPEES